MSTDDKKQFDLLIEHREGQGTTIHLLSQHGRVMCHCAIHPTNATVVREIPVGLKMTKLLCEESLAGVKAACDARPR